VQYEYNEIGQVVDKKLHNVSGTTYLQSIDYRYNIRGWLRSINNAQLSVNGDNDDANDYFGMEIIRNTAESGLSNTLYYNGNISALKWKGPGGASGSSGQRSYKYAYDKSDRLKTATFQGHNGTSWTAETNTLNESMGYDANGNILTLQRSQNLRGFTIVNNLPQITATQETIDNLSYTYATGASNRITKLEDAVAAGPVGDKGFKNGVNTTTEFTYATDGSLTADNNKGISSIAYNILGKPRTTTFTDGRTIGYTYDASGNKLKMVVTQGTSTTTDYVNGFV
jgi:YD repeat-containing protein